MLKPPLIGLLNQTAARTPELPISHGKGVSLTHAERGKFHQGNGSEFTKKAAELQLYIVTWNMKGRVRVLNANFACP